VEKRRQWRRDYLLSIREMATRHTPDKQAVSAGGIVILKDEHTPRCFWKLARVVELLLGRDGHVQAASIKFRQEASYVTSTNSVINTFGGTTRSPQLIDTLTYSTAFYRVFFHFDL